MVINYLFVFVFMSIKLIAVIFLSLKTEYLTKTINFIVKISEKFFERNAKNSPENSLTLSRNRKSTKRISLSYDINDHVYLKSKSVLFRMDLVNFKLRRIHADFV